MSASSASSTTGTPRRPCRARRATAVIRRRTSTSTRATSAGVRRPCSRAPVRWWPRARMGDATGAGGARPANSAFAAIDGDDTTAVGVQPRQPPSDRPGPSASSPSAPIASVDLVGGVSAPTFQSVRVVTADGASEPVDLGPGRAGHGGGPGRTDVWLRIETVGQAADVRAALAEVDVPGLDREKRLRLPDHPGGVGDSRRAILLTAAQDARTGCVRGRRRRALPARVATSRGRRTRGFRRELDLAGTRPTTPRCGCGPAPAPRSRRRCSRTCR